MSRRERRKHHAPRNLRCMVCQFKVKPGPNAVVWKNRPAHQTCLDTLVVRAQDRAAAEA